MNGYIPICKCNNCGAIMRDNNPCQDPTMLIESIALLLPEIDEDYECPDCGSDGTIIDITEPSIIAMRTYHISEPIKL